VLVGSTCFMENTRTYWWKNAKIYELYIDKFAGDIKGLTGRLDYFTKLGVNCLHILPHFPSPMVDDGYDVSDYRGVRPELGTLEDFTTLIKEAHGKGIRIIVDLVLNHTSDQHPWFIEARASHTNSKRDYYLWSDTGNEYADAPNMFPGTKPRNWIRNDATGDLYFATFYPSQPDLNWDNPTVFDEMMVIMEFWAARGVDGFRFDSAPHIVKRDHTNSMGLPETHAMLKKIRAVLQQKYPNVILLAESVTESKTYFGESDECHMVYNFPLMRQIWVMLMNGDTAALQAVVRDMEDIPENCEWATFLRNHDELTLRTLPEDITVAMRQFLDPEGVYSFSKYPAVRVAEVFKGNQDKIVNAFKILYSIPGAPIMYYGDEIGMRNLPPKEGVRDARLYVRGTFDWHEAETQMTDPNSLFNQVAKIVRRVPVVLPEKVAA